LASGNLKPAESLLGRPYGIDGRVVHGEKIGRTLGFPTANICIKQHARLPLSGVFAVTASGIAPQPLPAAASLGVRPTLADGLKPVLEIHLLDFARDIYGAHVRVNFLHKLRDEEKYATLEELKTQIAHDVAAVRRYFESA
jgi:riboflavin kinase/FMN adenylyltransferase